MSKRLVISVIASIAMSIGGFFASCGSGDNSKSITTDILDHPERFNNLSSEEMKALAAGKEIEKR